jgi:potassium/sodium efflux P-type ATPase
LQSGDKVSADLRLFDVKELRIDEAVLTGESVPVDKALEPVEQGAPLGDRVGMAFSGTLVTYGQGTGVVTSTGQKTEIGRISAMLADVKAVTTPLVSRITAFGRVLSVVILAAAGATFVFGVAVRGYTATEMFMAAVGVAVAAIPEGLPAIMTITLAIGVQRMAARHAIIRRLPAVDTLGAVTVICSDKTGTLTRSEMTVQSVVTPMHRYEVGGVGYAPEGEFSVDGEALPVPADNQDLATLLRAALLCNEASVKRSEGRWELQGDPTEGALVTAAMKAGLEQEAEAEAWPRLDTIPFESEHRFMATLHEAPDGRRVVFLKGAPERVIAMCSRQGGDGGETLDRARWEAAFERVAADGHRLLAVAAKDVEQDRASIGVRDVEHDLALLGLVGIIDPPRDEAITAVGECQQAGIRVKMITGDHVLTARVVGRQIGIGDGETAMVGRDIEQLEQPALMQRVRHVDVFARVSPEHKLRLVQAIQAHGDVVAMTGDGVNDAPALKRADVGVAMGIKGTEVSKEAADMVLTDDNFASIAHAVKEGRTVYDNLSKALLFILPTNGGEALTIIVAILLGFALPLTPVQILWVNMVTAITLALSLALDPPEADVMRRPPRDPARGLVTRFFLWRITFVSLIICAGTFGMFVWMKSAGAAVEEARTAAVNTLVMFEVFYLFNTRHVVAPSLNADALFGNRWVILAAAAVVAVQMVFTYTGVFHRLFATAPLSVWQWAIIVPVAASVFVLVELEKWVVRRYGLAG